MGVVSPQHDLKIKITKISSGGLGNNSAQAKISHYMIVNAGLYYCKCFNASKMPF